MPLVVLISSIGAAYIGKEQSKGVFLLIIALLTGGHQMYILETENRLLDLYSEKISLEEYFDPWLATYRLQKSADQILPLEAHVAVVGEGELFYLHRKAQWDSPWERSAVLLAANASTPDQLRSVLLNKGYTHLFYSPHILRRLISVKLIVPPLSPNDITTLEAMLEKCRPVVTDTYSGAVVYDLAF